MDRLSEHILADVSDQTIWKCHNMPAWVCANKSACHVLTRAMSLEIVQLRYTRRYSKIRTFATRPPSHACLYRSLLNSAMAKGCLLLCRFLMPVVSASLECHNVKFSAGIGRSLLAAAAHNGHVQVCRWLYRQLMGRLAFFRIHDNDLRINIHLLFGRVAQCGHLDVCRWLHNTFWLTHQEAHYDHDLVLRVTALNGHVALCRWLHDTFPHSSAQLQFEARHHRWARVAVDVAAKGYLDMLAWLKDVFPTLFCNDSIIAMLKRSAAKGHWLVCEWLLRHTEIIVSEADIKHMLHVAAHNGHVWVCKELLAMHFPQGLEGCVVSRLVMEAVKGCEIASAEKTLDMLDCLHNTGQLKRNAADGDPGLMDYFEALVEAAASGSLEVVQWLHDRLDKKKNLGQVYDTMAQRASQNGHTHVMQWVLQRHAMDFSNVSEQTIAKNGHLSTLMWLRKHRDDNGTLGPMFAVSTFCGAVLGGHLDVCHWVAGTFDQAACRAASLWLACRRTKVWKRCIERGDVNMCRWLLDTLLPQESEPSTADEEEASEFNSESRDGGPTLWAIWCKISWAFLPGHPFEVAAGRGHLDLCRWLEATFESTILTLTNVPRPLNHIQGMPTTYVHGMINALKNGHLDVCQWIYDVRLRESGWFSQHGATAHRAVAPSEKCDCVTRLWAYMIYAALPVCTGDRHKHVTRHFDRGDWDVALFVLRGTVKQIV